MDGVSISLIIVAFLAIIALLIAVSALRSNATWRMRSRKWQNKPSPTLNQIDQNSRRLQRAET